MVIWSRRARRASSSRLIRAIIRVSRSLMIVAACESSLAAVLCWVLWSSTELLMLVQLGALQCNSIEMFLRVYMLYRAAARAELVT